MDNEQLYFILTNLTVKKMFVFYSVLTTSVTFYGRKFNQSSRITSSDLEIDIHFCSFTTMTSDYGGAVEIRSTSSILLVSYTSFVSCTANSQGGGIYSLCNDNKVRYSCFQYCHCTNGWGPAIFMVGLYAAINQTTALNCPASGYVSHGDIMGFGNGEKLFSYLNFSNKGGGSLQNGGSIEVNNAVSVTMMYCISDSIKSTHHHTIINCQSTSITYYQYIRNTVNYLIYTKDFNTDIHYSMFYSNSGGLTYSPNSKKVNILYSTANPVSNNGNALGSTTGSNFAVSNPTSIIMNIIDHEKCLIYTTPMPNTMSYNQFGIHNVLSRIILILLY